MRKITLTILGISLLAITAWIIIERYNSGTGTDLNSLITTAIIRSNPLLVKDGKPVIEIASVKNPENGWYIVIIKSIHSTENFVPVKVILKDTGSDLRVIGNIETHFTETELLRYNVPDSVVVELEKT